MKDTSIFVLYIVSSTPLIKKTLIYPLNKKNPYLRVLHCSSTTFKITTSLEFIYDGAHIKPWVQLDGVNKPRVHVDGTHVVEKVT